ALCPSASTRAWRGFVTCTGPSSELSSTARCGIGSDGIQSVLEARRQRGGVTCVMAFDVLAVAGREVMGEPGADGRKRLEDFGASLDSPRVTLVPVSDDASRLWALWVGQQGGEGFVPKDRSSPYHPGGRSSAWLKLKEWVILDVVVEDGHP